MKKAELIKIIKEEVRNILSEQKFMSWKELAQQAINHKGFRRALRGSLRHKAAFVSTSGIIGMILTKYSVFNKVVGAVLNIVRDPDGPYAHAGRYMIDPETPVDPEFDQAFFNDVISDHFGMDGKYTREAQDDTVVAAGAPFIKEEVESVLAEKPVAGKPPKGFRTTTNVTMRNYPGLIMNSGNQVLLAYYDLDDSKPKTYEKYKKAFDEYIKLIKDSKDSGQIPKPEYNTMIDTLKDKTKDFPDRISLVSKQMNAILTSK